MKTPFKLASLIWKAARSLSLAKARWLLHKAFAQAIRVKRRKALRKPFAAAAGPLPFEPLWAGKYGSSWRGRFDAARRQDDLCIKMA